MKLLKLTSIMAVLLAFFVVMLGAYTRLTDAGLGCPDWPGCYGQLVLSAKQDVLVKAQQLYPHTPIETRKAWTEMAHRYAAGTLVLLIMVMVGRVLHLRRQGIRISLTVPLLLIALLTFQALLGMWTVTLKLLPMVVMGHLLGGIIIFSCLCYFCLQVYDVAPPPTIRPTFIYLGLLIVFCQIVLGGFVSANYAGIACIGFPRCNGQWMPTLQLAKAFHLFTAIGENYQGGLLENASRVTLQMVHRMGAMVTLCYGFALSGWILYRVRAAIIRRVALLLVLLLCIQFGLGVINVVYLLPLWAAVAHNGVAALLMATLACLCYLTQGAQHASRV